MAREAFGNVDNIDRLFVGGRRAAFTLKPGHWFDEQAVAESLEAKGLGLEGFRWSRRPRATTAWVLRTEPFT